MKKHFLAMLLLLFVCGINPAKALTVTDVSVDNWAADEIVRCIENGYLTVTPQGQFKPDASISRLDFVVALLKVLQSDDVTVIEKSAFKDVNEKTKNQESIRALQQLRIIYGYPDRTFKPEIQTKRSEAMSAIGNITKRHNANVAVLDRFTDKDDVPSWVKTLYAKNVENGLYVNHPDPYMLRPNDYLTRAEAAVLLYKISNNLELIESRYRKEPKPEVVLLGKEYMNVYERAPRNTVSIYNTKMDVEAGNVLSVVFDDDFDSKVKTVQVGDEVNFVITDNVYTERNTLVLPAQTRLNARVVRMEGTRWKNNNYKALLVAQQATLPNGNIIPMAGVPFTKKNPITRGSSLIIPDKKQRLGDKVAEYVGRDREEITKAEFLVRYSSQLSPRVRYKKKISDPVYILLTADMAIPVTQ